MNRNDTSIAATQADHRDRSIAIVATLLANAVPDAFAHIGEIPVNTFDFDLDRDFSDRERRRYRELAAAVVRRLAQERGSAAPGWNAIGPVGIAAWEVTMSNEPFTDNPANAPEDPARRSADTPKPPLDVDPMEGGGVVPGAPPGETFGSVATTPPSEAELNERAGRRPKP